MSVLPKQTRFRDIPPFVKDGSWSCDHGIFEVIRFLDDMILHDKLQMDPDFQRDHVWTEEKQIAWLEYMLRGGRSGTIIYINHPTWQGHHPDSGYNDVVLVDGKQRLRAIRRFADNEIKVFGSYRNEYTDRPSIINHAVKTNVNTLQSKREVLEWYKGLNSGGEPHTKADIDKVDRLLELEPPEIIAPPIQYGGAIPAPTCSKTTKRKKK